MAEFICREDLLKNLYPLGIPKSRYEWDYTINARAVYEAIMKLPSINGERPI